MGKFVFATRRIKGMLSILSLAIFRATLLLFYKSTPSNRDRAKFHRFLHSSKRTEYFSNETIFFQPRHDNLHTPRLACLNPHTIPLSRHMFESWMISVLKIHAPASGVFLKNSIAALCLDCKSFTSATNVGCVYTFGI